MKKLGLLFAIIVIASLVISSCAAPTPQVIEKTVEKIVPQTVVVEKPVEKVVEQTVVVEKTVQVAAPTATPSPGKVALDFAINAEPLSMDPGISGDYIAVWLAKQMFMGLTDNAVDGSVQPQLATKWSVSDDGLTWTFDMRQDVPWVSLNPATGEFKNLGPVTAKDVEYQVKRILDPRTGSTSSSGLYIIKGAQEYNKADPNAANFAELRDAVGVKAVDDDTVQFTLTQPAAYFPSIAGGMTVRPVQQAAVEAHPDRWAEPGWIVTNGPYALQDWLHGDRITMVKNPLWPDAKDVQIEELRGVFVGEQGTAMAMYEANDLDFMGDPGWDVPLPDIPRVKGDPVLSKEYSQLPRQCDYFYFFETFKPPFDNVLVRKAFSAAIDRQALIDNVLKAGQQPANAFAPPGIFGNVAGDKSVGGYLVMDNYADQVKQAQAWLAEAGFPEGEGLGQIRLLYPTSQQHALIAQAIQAMWTAAFPKADIKLENMEWSSYIKTMQPSSPDAEKPHMVRAGYCGGSTPYPDENNWVAEYFKSTASSNWGGYKNPEFDALVTAAAKETDPAKRQQMYKEAESILIDKDAVIAPIYFWSFVRMQKPWMTKLIVNPSGSDPVWQWQIDSAAKQAATKQ